MNIKTLHKTNISCDFLYIVIVNIIFAFGVNGKVVTRTIVSLSPQYLTPVRANNHAISSSSTDNVANNIPKRNRPDWTKTILMKQLLELDCLRQNYNKHRLNKLHQNFPLEKQQFQPSRKEFSIIKGSSINDPRPKAQRENPLKNKSTKNRRFNGDDKVIIFTPIGQKGWEYPIYIPKAAPGGNVNQFSKYRNQSQVVDFGFKVNRTLQVKHSNGNTSTHTQTALISKNATQGHKSEGISKINVPTSLQDSESNITDGSNREAGKVVNPSYFPVTFRWPIRKPLPNDYKLSKFSKFPDKFHTLFGKNASGPHKWFPTRSQPVQPYEVKEITEGNVQIDVTKEDDPSANKRKPHTGGDDRITSQVSTKAQTNSKTDHTTELLQDSISKILQSLMGLDRRQTPGKLKSQITREGSTVHIEEKGRGPSVTKIPGQYPIKNLQHYSPELPPKNKHATNHPSTEKYLHSSGTQVKTNSFTVEDNMPDYQKVLPNLMSEYLSNQDPKIKPLSVTSFVPLEPFTPKTFNNPTLTTKAIGRDLKLPSNPPSLLDLLAYSAHQKSNVPPNEDSQFLTSPPDITSNYYEHTEEVTLTSSPHDETTTVMDPEIWLGTDQASRRSPEMSTTESGSSLQEPITTLDLSHLFEDVTTAFTQPHGDSTAMLKTDENEQQQATTTETQFHQRNEDEPAGDATHYQTTTNEVQENYTTVNYNEVSYDPLTIDFLSTTAKFDSKNMDPLLKSGRKLNIDTDPEEIELTNLLSNATEQRRSDILINDILDEYEKFKHDVPFEYLNILRQNISNSDLAIDDIISIIPSVVDDLRQNKLSQQDLTILSQAFGKYWPDILALSKDTTIDMLPLLQIEKEEDLKNFIQNFLETQNRETITIKKSGSSGEKSPGPPTYDYMDEYKDIYQDIVGQDIIADKRKRFRTRRDLN